MASSDKMSPTEKLKKLRDLMKKNNVDAYIIPSEDDHNSEICAPCHERREFMSSFTGSSGICVVTNDHAGMWTDGRYYIQAEEELPREAGWVLHRLAPGKTSFEMVVDWLKANTTGTVAFDATTLLFACGSMNSTLGGRAVPLTENLVDTIWDACGRPSRPKGAAYLHEEKFHNITVKSKIESVKREMERNKCGLLVVTQLDEVAYLLNIRGSDIPYAPLVFAYVVVTLKGGPVVFIDDHKLGSDLKTYLSDNGVTDIRPYEALYSDLPQIISSHGLSPEYRCWADVRANLKLHQLCEETLKNMGVEPSAVMFREMCPLSLLKAVKSERELKGFRDCHVRDGAALSKFLCWLDGLAANDTLHEHTECTVADKLEEFRKTGDLFKELSFPTISAMGPNGALCHYRPTTNKCAHMTKGMYLVDSGGHYYDGTTDVTRTVHLSVPSDEQRETFTLVLKGHIALANAVFPVSTCGPQLDALARIPLWSTGRDYCHGTGHGVGHMLCVHEGPQGISGRLIGQAAKTPLQKGMILSNEPGFYKEKEYGIRIENLVAVKICDEELEVPGFLRFEQLTVVPIQRKLINFSMLNGDEIGWLNDYHADVYRKLSPLMKEEPYLTWLKRATSKIEDPKDDLPPPPRFLYE